MDEFRSYTSIKGIITRYQTDREKPRECIDLSTSVELTRFAGDVPMALYGHVALSAPLLLHPRGHAARSSHVDGLITAARSWPSRSTRTKTTLGRWRACSETERLRHNNGPGRELRRARAGVKLRRGGSPDTTELLELTFAREALIHPLFRESWRNCDRG